MVGLLGGKGGGGLVGGDRGGGGRSDVEIPTNSLLFILRFVLTVREKVSLFGYNAVWFGHKSGHVT